MKRYKMLRDPYKNDLERKRKGTWVPMAKRVAERRRKRKEANLSRRKNR